jgi:putative membrane protein
MPLNFKSSFSNRVQLATAIAILFHSIGLLGILWLNNTIFLKSTALNLLLMFLLILYTQEKISKSFLIFISICFITGIAVEIIGTSTGFLFGDYQYGESLGPKIYNVPLIIGINWFVIIYCCGISMHMLMNKLTDKIGAENILPQKKLKLISLIVDGATMTVLFDWLMEPIAIKLDFWHWKGTTVIPIYNYICWFLVSVLLLFVFQKCNFNKHNKFAVHLLMIQTMFFLLLRTFL